MLGSLFEGDKKPLYLYLGLTVLTSIIWYGYSLIKTKKIPGFLTIGCQILCICICALSITSLSGMSSIAGWACAILASLMGVSMTVNYLRTGSVFKAMTSTVV
jgi:hypothetical protein